MNRASLRRTVTVSVILCFVLLNLGCGSKVDGKYSGADGLFTVEFKSDKATMTTSALGNKSNETADYTVSGDNVTVKTAGGDMTFKILSDGSLQGPQGTFKKISG